MKPRVSISKQNARCFCVFRNGMKSLPGLVYCVSIEETAGNNKRNIIIVTTALLIFMRMKNK